ncbi:hypothetical protein EAG_11093 [Camponotus floridanus]|uniref:Uncharacterized protein n=1 Tax=Camponotus floridanus TaxID=104421 RepID=E1ZW61_CAMFO|nr:hypothetical protein EAG_11093 [Camponotus floridanus]
MTSLDVLMTYNGVIKTLLRCHLTSLCYLGSRVTHAGQVEGEDPPHLSRCRLVRHRRCRPGDSLPVIVESDPPRSATRGNFKARNETADFLAEEATEEGVCSEYLIPYSDLFAAVRRTSIRFLSSQALHKGSLYFDRYGPFSFVPCLHRSNLVGSPACDCGSPVQDIDYIVELSVIRLSPSKANNIFEEEPGGD